MDMTGYISESEVLSKKLILVCVTGVFVSIGTVYMQIKTELNEQAEKVQNMAESNTILDRNMSTLTKTVNDLSDRLNELSTEWKSFKDNSSYIYTTISSLQRDVSVIKEKLNIANETIDKQIEGLTPEKKAFIISLENLVKDGAPFDSFLDSNKTKIDMTKYRTAEALIKFSQQNTKSITDLKKDYTNVGNTVFKTNFEESFWERQKRVIKEKIADAIKIRKFNENSSPLDDSSSESDKTKYEKAGKFLSDEKYEDAFKILNSLTIENDSFGNFLIDLKARKELEEAFREFKNEFADIESNAFQNEKTD